MGRERERAYKKGLVEKNNKIIEKINYDVITVRPRFDLGSTSKTLNLSLLRFNERSGFENLASDVSKPWAWIPLTSKTWARSPLIKNWAPMSFSLQDGGLNASPFSHLPFHLFGTSDIPLSLKLELSGQILVSITPTITSSPYEAAGHTPKFGCRPRNFGV